MKCTAKCETCGEEATVHIQVINLHFCQPCLEKIDKRIAEINAMPEADYQKWVADTMSKPG